jgi:dihydroneopterin aldolase
MNIPTLLLENIVQNIEKDLKKSFFEINFYKIRIDKCNPPMGQKIDSSYVCNEWKKK